MRFLIIIVVMLTSCKSADIDFFDIMEKREIQELNTIINDHRIEKGNWPTSGDIENYRLTNNYLKRFSKVVLTDNPDSSLNVVFRLQYKDFEDPIRSLDMTEILTPLDSGRYAGKIDLDNLVLQNNIELGRRTRLTKDEKKQYKKWEQLRIASRLLTVENTRTNERLEIKAGSHIYLFSKDTLLVMQDTYSKQGWINQRAKWILSTINLSDSTINIDIYGAGTLRRLVKFTDIDSLNVESKPGTFRIIGVKE